MSGSLDHKLDRIVGRAAELRAMLNEALGGDEFARASKELSELEPVVERINELRAAERGAAEAERMLDDPELRELAEAELFDLRQRLPGRGDEREQWRIAPRAFLTKTFWRTRAASCSAPDSPSFRPRRC